MICILGLARVLVAPYWTVTGEELAEVGPGLVVVAVLVGEEWVVAVHRETKETAFVAEVVDLRQLGRTTETASAVAALLELWAYYLFLFRASWRAADSNCRSLTVP